MDLGCESELKLTGVHHQEKKKDADLFKVELLPRCGSSSGSGLLVSSFLETFLLSLSLGLNLLFPPLLTLVFALSQRFSVGLRASGFDLSIEPRDTSGAAIILELPTPRSQNCQDLLLHFRIRRVVGSKML